MASSIRKGNNAWLGRLLRRIGVAGAITGMAGALHLFSYGMMVEFRMPISPRPLQSTFSSLAAMTGLGGAVLLYILLFLAPRAALAIDKVLPFTVMAHSRNANNRSRDSTNTDSDDEEEEKKEDDDEGENSGYLAHPIQFSCARDPEMVDTLYVGYLAFAWHIVMAAPICTLVFETHWTPEGQMLFSFVSGVLGLFVLILSMRALVAAKLIDTEMYYRSVGTNGKLAADNGSKTSNGGVNSEGGANAILLRRRGGKGGGSSDTQGALTPNTTAAPSSPTPPATTPLVSSSLHNLAWPLFYHGAVALIFLWLHVDRGGSIHFHPFD